MNGIIFRDLLLNMLLGLTALVLFNIFFLNPPANQNENTANPPGNLIVTLTWPSGPNDVDLWLMAPGEKSSIGYSNKNGVVWNLLRDDLGGDVNDVTGMNYENAYSRGLPAGEYIVNIQCYKCSGFPFEANVEVGLNHMDGTSTQIIVNAVLKFETSAQEITVIRFKIDSNGELIKDSIHRLYQPLRKATY